MIIISSSNSKIVILIYNYVTKFCYIYELTKLQGTGVRVGIEKPFNLIRKEKKILFFFSFFPTEMQHMQSQMDPSSWPSFSNFLKSSNKSMSKSNQSLKTSKVHNLT